MIFKLLPEGVKFDPDKPVFSASQLQRGTDCLRKWGFEKLDLIPMPQSAAAARGSDVHALLENLGNNKPVDPLHEHAPLAARMFQGRITPRTRLEHEFKIDLGHAYAIGYIDRLDLWEEPVVTDYKTTSDLKWAKNAKALQGDIQANLYALVAMLSAESKKAFAQWIYGQIGTQKIIITNATFDLTKTQEYLYKLEPLIKLMAQAKAEKLKAITLNPNYKHCTAYGGCAYRTPCGHSPREWLGAQMSKSFLEQLKQEAGLPSTTPTPKLAPIPETKAETKTEIKTANLPSFLTETKAEIKNKTEAVSVPSFIVDGAKGINAPEGPATKMPDVKEKTKKAKKGFTLYLNCAPIKGGNGVIHSSEFFAPILKQVAETIGTSHWRAKEYAEGEKLLGAYVAKDLNENGNLSALIASTDDPAVRACLDTLCEYASVIIKA